MKRETWGMMTIESQRDMAARYTWVLDVAEVRGHIVREPDPEQLNRLRLAMIDFLGIVLPEGLVTEALRQRTCEVGRVIDFKIAGCEVRRRRCV